MSTARVDPALGLRTDVQLTHTGLVSALVSALVRTRGYEEVGDAVADPLPDALPESLVDALADALADLLGFSDEDELGDAVGDDVDEADALADFLGFGFFFFAGARSSTRDLPEADD